MEALPRVCVIGAGSSGNAVVKALNDLERRGSRRRYRDGAERHTMQVDFAGCLHRLQRQLRACRRRAAIRAAQSPARTACGGGQELPADEPH